MQMLVMLYSFNAYSLDFSIWEQLHNSQDEYDQIISVEFLNDEARAISLSNQALSSLGMEPLYCMSDGIYESQIEWHNLIFSIRDEYNELLDGVEVNDTIHVILYYLLDRFPCI